MASLIKMMSAQYDLWVKRFEAFYAETSVDHDACIAILEDVRRKELNRVKGESVLHSTAFAGIETSFRLIAVKDTRNDEIVGCIRITPASELFDIPSSREEYHLDVFDKKQLAQLSVLTRLAVLKPYRKTPASIVLMAYAFIEWLKEGGKATLMSCEPNLLPLYKKLGLRTLGYMHNSPSGGYRLPMICLPDKAHLKSVRSPGLSLLKEVKWDEHKDICDWYNNYTTTHPDLRVGAAFYSDAADPINRHKIVTEGLSPKGRKSFLTNAIELKCKKGDLLIAENDGGKSFGYVHRGQVRVNIEQDVYVLLDEGDIFGEIAFVLDIHRSAEVVAESDDTIVVMFSVSALNRLESDHDKMIIWRNLSRTLAEKLIITNSLLD